MSSSTESEDGEDRLGFLSDESSFYGEPETTLCGLNIWLTEG